MGALAGGVAEVQITKDAVGHVLLVSEGGDFLHAALAEDFYETQHVRSWGELLEATSRQTPDIILLESPPSLGGEYDLCRKIKSLDNIHDIPLVIFSKKGGIAERIEGFAAGADDVFTPPFDKRELLARLRVQLTRKHYRDALKHKLRQSMEMAYQDSLTGLNNRRYMESALGEMLPQESLALFLMDIDGFKRVNDIYGHDGGDRILKQVAGALKQSLRRDDVLCRIGGDEFLALLPQIPMRLIAPMTTRLLRSVKNLSLKESQHNAGKDRAGSSPKERITISIGIAFSEKKERAAPIMKRADEALYEAKKRGGNGFFRASSPLVS